jgi:hypothetical protein
METRERLFSEIGTLCKETGLDFEKIRQELSEFVGTDELIDYYISRGPMPDFPETVFDLMILSNKCLYDCDRRQQGTLFNFLLLSKIGEISEAFVGNDFFRLHFKVGDLGSGLIVVEKLSDIVNMRRFSTAVRKKILESIYITK